MFEPVLNKFKHDTAGANLARDYAPFSISQIIGAIGCLVQLVPDIVFFGVRPAGA